MFLIQPTFTSGFAKNPGESAYPNLWNNLVLLLAPSMGKQGEKLRDWSGRNHFVTLGQYGSNVFSGGTATASSDNGGPSINNAYDGNYGSFWTSLTSSTLPQWTQYDLGSGVTKVGRKLMIVSRGGDANSLPIDFRFEASNDNFVSETVLLFSRVGESFSGTDQKWYTFDNDKAYRYYRLTITKTSGTNKYVQIMELALYELIPTYNYIGGKFGYALDYNGTTDRGLSDNIPEITTASQSMSVLFWLKTSTSQTSNVNILQYQDLANLSPSKDWYIMFKTNLTIGGFGNISEYNVSNVSSASLQDGKWHRVVIIEGQTNLDVYVDGIFKQTFAITQSHGNFTTSHRLLIASQNTGGNPTIVDSKYIGLLENISLYNRDLTADEIRQDYFGASPLIEALYFNYGVSSELSQAIDDSLSLSDSWSEQITPDNQSIGDTLDLQDSWQLLTNPEQESVSDTLELDDTWSTLINPESQILSDDLTLSDNWVASVFGTFNIPINLDLRWLALIAKNVQLSLSWLLAKSINTDFRWLAITKKSISTDFRWLSAPYTTILPIAHSDIQIFINGTDVLLGNDVDVETGNIIHTAGQTSQASFVLARKHDDLDRTHLGVASQITNQNIVQIYIDGHLEFDGYIMTINVDSETETVAITAKMDEPADSRHSIALPLPSVNEKLHLYHCLVNTVQVDNPKEDTRAVIVGSNGRYWNGSEWVFYITDALLFATDIAAQDYIDDYIDLSVDLIFESKQPSVAGRERNPQYYHGVKVNLGTKIQQQVNRYYLPDTVINDKGINAQQIEDGTFIIQPNYTYFWTIRARNLRTGSYNGITQYIGTSLASTTTDLWSLISVSPMYQKIRDNVETELGYYYVGSAPYKEMSPKNGLLITDTKWQDRNNGLYAVKEASYDYQNYAKLVAGLEYQKLQNVHGDILPVTSASLDITFDAYYYYNVKLLTRINVTNTTVANTYNNLNGFPVSVKSININFASMKITLTTDNRLAQEEIDELDAQMPDEESSLYVTKEHSTLILRKFDLKTWKYVT